MTATGHLTVYVGTYTDPSMEGRAEGIYVCHLDPDSGEVTPGEVVTGPGTVNPSYLALAPDGRFLYAANEISGDMASEGQLSAFALTPDKDHPRYLDQRSTQGLAPCFVSTDHQGRFCLVANYESGSVCVLPVGDDGRLEEASDLVPFAGSSAHPERQRGPHAHMIVPTPGGGCVLAVDLGTDRIMAFHLDSSGGRLVAAAPPWTQVPAGTGCRHLAFHPERPFLYVIGELDSSVTVFGYEEECGTLEAIQKVATLPDDFSGENQSAAIRLAPGGRHLYASNRGHDSLAVFALDGDTGRLSPRGHVPTQGAGPRDLVIDGDGRLLLVANQGSDSLVTFWIDQETGSLEPTGYSARVPTPACVLLSAVGPAEPAG